MHILQLPIHTEPCYKMKGSFLNDTVCEHVHEIDRPQSVAAVEGL